MCVATKFIITRIIMGFLGWLLFVGDFIDSLQVVIGKSDDRFSNRCYRFCWETIGAKAACRSYLIPFCL